MRDERIWRMRALLDWYERKGAPNDEQVINAFTAIWTGGYGPEGEPESMESRLEALEAAVTKLLRAQEPTENTVPPRPASRFKRLYCDIDDFRERLIDEAEKTPSERDKGLINAIVTKLDEIIDGNTE